MLRTGDIVDLTITETGMNGEGVARCDGLVVFVPLTLVSERVTAQIRQVKKQYAVARVIKMLQPAPERVQPRCPIFYRCGGCDMQHIRYRTQLEIKRKTVADCLRKARVDAVVDETTACGAEYGYRNKIQVPFGMQGDRIVAGYFRPGTHEIVPFGSSDEAQTGHCPLHEPMMSRIVESVRAVAQRAGVSVYDETAHDGILRHAVVRKVGDAYAIVIVVCADRLPHRQDFIDALDALGIRYSLYVSCNRKRTNVILGDATHCVHGERQLCQDILGVHCSVSPESFMQINDAVRDAIYRRVQDYVAQFAHCVAIDAYSGTGILSNLIAARASSVVAIEIVPQAVQDAQALADRNGNRDKITNICGDCRTELPAVIDRIGGRYRIAMQMRLEDEPFQAIASGRKRYELRLNDDKRRALRVGDVVRFVHVQTGRMLDCRVSSLQTFDDFADMYRALPPEELCADMSAADTAETFRRAMRAYYSDERVAQCGALAIGVEIVPTGILVLDPPRKGCDEQVLRAILDAAPQQIVYISCNPATLARDLAILQERYTVDRVAPYDMFPQTKHIETLICLKRKQPK